MCVRSNNGRNGPKETDLMNDKERTAGELEGLSLAVADFETRRRESEPKICGNCIHFNDINSNPAAPGIWYSLKCAAPDVQAAEGINPQTGDRGYLRHNDLGGAYFDDDPRPYCRDINPDGKCDLFSRSESPWRMPPGPKPPSDGAAILVRPSAWTELRWALARFWRSITS